MKKNLVFASKTFQVQPFTIGGQTFFGQRLNGEEELLMTDMAQGASTTDQVKAQIGNLATMLTRRHQGEPGTITPDWVGKQLGLSNSTALLGFLRTGVRPADYLGGTLDLPAWGDDIELGEADDARTFTARATCFAETLVLAAVNIEDENSATLYRMADTTAQLVSARLTGDSAAVDSSWLLRQLQLSEISTLVRYLNTGDLPEDAAESPNADPTPEALSA